MESEAAVLLRAGEIAGLPLAALGDLHGHKGGVGELIERALGLTRSNAAAPDFAALGIEVKSLPVHEGRVAESTYVCSASPSSIAAETWLTSSARQKLARVLFVPVEARGAPHARRSGTAFLWSPHHHDEAILRADWEDLADLVANGLGFAITARRGRALQLRPKAANAGVTRRQRNVAGDDYDGRPQGFYLRRAFTQRIVDDVFSPK